jgi:hypothetical protein
MRRVEWRGDASPRGYCAVTCGSRVNLLILKLRLLSYANKQQVLLCYHTTTRLSGPRALECICSGWVNLSQVLRHSLKVSRVVFEAIEVTKKEPIPPIVWFKLYGFLKCGFCAFEYRFRSW